LKFDFFDREKADYSVKLLCELLEVSESGYHAWKSRTESLRKRENRALTVQIKSAFNGSRKSYGSPRLTDELKAQGVVVGRHRVAKLMKAAKIVATVPKRFKNTTQSKHKFARSPNVVERKFTEIGCAANRLWVTDLTYIWTAQGWLYLCVFIDAYSRKVVGFSIDESMETRMVNEALNMAFRRRDPKAQLIIHSDQGVQYASHDYRSFLKTRNIVQSMSRKGDCWDNSMAESFFASLKKELIYRQAWISKKQASDAITEWIECFYNRERRHSSIGNLSPVDYEVLTKQPIAA